VPRGDRNQRRGSILIRWRSISGSGTISVDPCLLIARGGKKGGLPVP